MNTLTNNHRFSDIQRNNLEPPAKTTRCANISLSTEGVDASMPVGPSSSGTKLPPDILAMIFEYFAVPSTEELAIGTKDDDDSD